MTHQLSPELDRLVQEKMTAGRYQSANELLLDAMVALEEIESRQEALRAELQERVAKAGGPLSQPFDREAFRAEVRRRFGVED